MQLGWRTRLGLVSVVAGALVAGCQRFPAPTAPQPALTKAQVAALAKCQSAIKKAQLNFVKTKLATLGACVDAALNLQLALENGLIEQGAYAAGLEKTRGKCTKGYGKITAASTKMVDAIVKSCTSVESSVLGAYDGLRFQSALTSINVPHSTITELAGVLCTLSEEYVDAQIWQAAPRMMEVLDILGPEFAVFQDQNKTNGFPNVPLDPRCPPFVTPGPNPTATP